MVEPLRYLKQDDENENFLQWERGQVIPVKFTNVPELEKRLIINYCIAKINSLPLDIKLVASQESHAMTGGISITFDKNISSISTRSVYGSTKTPLPGQPYVFDICSQSIKVSSSMLEQFKPPPGYNPNSNYEIALKNSCLHELLHAIGFRKHTASYVKPAANGKPAKIVVDTLMSSGLGSAYLEWTYSDEIRLLWMYGINPSTRSKTLTFNEEDIGKWCFLVHQTNKNMSIALEITSTEMTIDYFRKGPYKEVIQAIEVRND